jgi:DNA repair protein RecN (Recombination protein N)
MLQSLHLQDFVIVERADIDFAPGFSVLTGETGAGKSILLDALGLILGGRADAGVVREGRARADLTASFRSHPRLDAWLVERELSGDPGTVLLRRVIDADGRSRALVNGQPTTIAVLREISDCLVDVHGQHAAQSLARPSAQRQLLDACAGVQPELGALSEAYERGQAARRSLELAQAGDRASKLEYERLLWQVSELDGLKLGPQEWDELNAAQRRLAHAASLAEGAQAAADALSGADDALTDRLRTISNRLRSLAQIDSRLQEPLDLLESAAIQAEEAASSFAQYADRLDIDPERLAEIEQRIGAVFSASRKFRLAPESIPGALDSMRVRLTELERAQDIGALERQVLETQTRFDELASAVSLRRKSCADRFERGVTELLAQLGMAGAQFTVGIETAPPGPSGIDTVEFGIVQHGSRVPRPIAKVASGGELSRIGLAIAVMAAQDNPVPTLIFDEADAGVGGAVAEVIGAMMRRLGSERQVLCVTHLPQVAACAHQHFKVRLEPSAAGSVSTVSGLDRSSRVEEIARMLGGVAITATTRRHAREMLAQSGQDLPAIRASASPAPAAR